jgi:hypothetical protein
MAKRKKGEAAEGEDMKPPMSTDHGVCPDCGEVVDVVVEIHQSLGKNRFICVACRCERIMRKAREAVGNLKELATQSREEAQVPLLPLKAGAGKESAAAGA